MQTRTVLAAVGAAAAMVGMYALLFFSTNAASITMLHVGQGDAFLLKDGHGSTVLIDTGANNTVLSGLGRSLGFWKRHIDAIVITHPDEDHIGGLMGTLERYSVGHIFIPAHEKKAGSMKRMFKGIDTARTNITTLAKGDTLSLHGMTLTALWPPQHYETANANNESIVLHVQMGARSALFMGDVEKEVEKRLIAENAIPKVELLKVGHHGSKSSTSAELLEKASPSVALISAGKNNPFGHPADEVVKQLAEYGVSVFSTTEKGTVFCKAGARLWECQ